MKNLNLLLYALCIAFLVSPLASTAQISTIPSVDIKNLEGEKVNTSEFTNDGNPIVISFWATWCKPCIKELEAINESFIDWNDETGVRVIAVSTDDSRNSSRVMPFVNTRAWDFDVLLDENSDFKRAMNVNNIPHTFLVNGEGEIVWQHNSYTPGDEENLYELIKKVKAGEEIAH